MELTDARFWDAYWAKLRLPSEVDEKDSFDRCLAAALRKHLAGCAGSALEIGCAPGKWLVFMTKELGLKPSGIEYSEAGMSATIRNLGMLGVDYGEILSGDFFKLSPAPRFDVVASFGFIEHFNDVDAVISRHLEWCKPGAMLVLGVPNFRGIYRPLQSMLDKTILDKHNLGIMSLDWFKEAAQRHRLEIKYLGYIGSFEPALPIPPERARTPLRFIVKTALRLGRHARRPRIFDSINSGWFSSYMLLICKKGGRITD
ncbi:MAG: class I SAM-dependent methyltransferase [Deltaproteobacteria bacterium]|nr:class I SAM-dependent methyltransferase [Deltaproteobacteria bacterium]